MALIGVSYGGGDAITRWLDTEPEAIGCIEVAADDFYRLTRHYLTSLAARYPLIVRAPSLSIGTPGALHRERLRSLAEVVAIANPLYVIHPVGFSHTDEIDLGRSLPISLNAASLAVVVEHVLELTQACGKPILVQNITAPLRIPGTIAETEFLNRLCEESGCGLFVDITSLLVASRNHRFDPHSWLRELDGDKIRAAQIGGRPIDKEAWAVIGTLAQGAHPDALIIEARGDSGGIDRLQRDIERLRAIASDGESAVVRHPTGSSCVERHQSAPSKPKNAPRRSRAVTRATRRSVPADSWSREIDIAADASLYVLDREGVFFSESRQEVYLFNTAATLIWCLAEQGLSVNAVIEAYQEAFHVSLAEATAHVAAILQQWFGLGYIRDPGLPVAAEIPLTTAVARLLTNPELRSQFRTSPQTMAAALRIGAADFDSFVTLDADDVDKQAEELADLRSGSRYHATAGRATTRAATTVAVDPDLLEAALRARMRCPASGRSQCYRLMTTIFCIDLPSGSLGADIHAALTHLRVAAQAADVVLSVEQADAGWIVFDGTTPVKYGRAAEIVPAVKQMLREIAVNRYRFFIKIHAAVVFFGDGGVLLPGAAGSGKTTLAAALLRSGGSYFSDEVALLEEDTLNVRPVPLALTIKDGSVEPLRCLYPELASLPQHMREDRQGVRYLSPPAESLFDDGQAHQIRWILFPHYDPTVESALVPLDRPTGLKRLLEESLVLPDLLDRGKVEALVRWMRGVQCFELPMSSLDAGVALVRSLYV